MNLERHSSVLFLSIWRIYWQYTVNHDNKHVLCCRGKRVAALFGSSDTHRFVVRCLSSVTIVSLVLKDDRNSVRSRFCHEVTRKSIIWQAGRWVYNVTEKNKFFYVSIYIYVYVYIHIHRGKQEEGEMRGGRSASPRNNGQESKAQWLRWSLRGRKQETREDIEGNVFHGFKKQSWPADPQLTPHPPVVPKSCSNPRAHKAEVHYQRGTLVESRPCWQVVPFPSPSSLSHTSPAKPSQSTSFPSTSPHEHHPNPEPFF